MERARVGVASGRWVGGGETAATNGSWPAVSARPSSSAHRILARAGSPTSAATSAICGAACIAQICDRSVHDASANTSAMAEAIRLDAGGPVSQLWGYAFRRTRVLANDVVNECLGARAPRAPNTIAGRVDH